MYDKHGNYPEAPPHERVKAARQWARAIEQRRFCENKMVGRVASGEILESDARALVTAERNEQDARNAYRELLNSAVRSRTKTT